MRGKGEGRDITITSNVIIIIIIYFYMHVHTPDSNVYRARGAFKNMYIHVQVSKSSL